MHPNLLLTWERGELLLLVASYFYMRACEKQGKWKTCSMYVEDQFNQEICWASCKLFWALLEPEWAVDVGLPELGPYQLVSKRDFEKAQMVGFYFVLGSMD